MVLFFKPPSSNGSSFRVPSCHLPAFQKFALDALVCSEVFSAGPRAKLWFSVPPRSAMQMRMEIGMFTPLHPYPSTHALPHPSLSLSLSETAAGLGSCIYLFGKIPSRSRILHRLKTRQGSVYLLSVEFGSKLFALSLQLCKYSTYYT